MKFLRTELMVYTRQCCNEGDADKMYTMSESEVYRQRVLTFIFMPR